MRTLNGITIFNATPRVIRFWREGWDSPVEVEPDEVINARPVETPAPAPRSYRDGTGVGSANFVTTNFMGDEAGATIVRRAEVAGADVIVGSIIAAQAYPGRVVAMTPAPGYERVAPAEKRMNPDKFTVF